jgi:hypothetical protein
MSDQKNWDAAVIKTWRTAGSVLDAMKLFNTLSGKRLDECDPPLKRVPPVPYPWKIGIRVFVANHLSKISKRLWDQTPDKDILLLRKLETSPYDTEKEALQDNDLKKEHAQYLRNRKKVAMNTLDVSNQGYDTDWNVNKGSVRVRRRR